MYQAPNPVKQALDHAEDQARQHNLTLALVLLEPLNSQSQHQLQLQHPLHDQRRVLVVNNQHANTIRHIVDDTIAQATAPPAAPSPSPTPIQGTPQPLLPPPPSNLSSVLAPLSHPNVSTAPAASGKRSSFHHTQGTALKRTRVAHPSAPPTPGFASRPRPLSMPSLRTPSNRSTSGAPFWGTVMRGGSTGAGSSGSGVGPGPAVVTGASSPVLGGPAPTPISTPLPPPPQPLSHNPRDDPRFLPLLQGQLQKKLSAAAKPSSEPSPHVAQIRSHALNPTATPSQSYTPFDTARAFQTTVSAGIGSTPGAGPSSMLRANSLSALPRLGALPGLGSDTGRLPPPSRLDTASSVGAGPSSVGAPGPSVAAGSTAGASGTAFSISASSGGGAFNCSLCDASFKRRSDMNRHVRVVHEKQRPFTCPKCNQRFGEKSNMQKHVRMVHENIRGFLCPVCGAAFGQRGNCEAHVRAVHEKRPGKYECTQCDKAFQRKSHLLEHFTHEHPNVPPPSARAKPRPAIASTVVTPAAARVSHGSHGAGLAYPVQTQSASAIPTAPAPVPAPIPSSYHFDPTNRSLAYRTPTHMLQHNPLPPPPSPRSHHRAPVPPPPPWRSNTANTTESRTTPGAGSSAADAALRQRRDDGTNPSTPAPALASETASQSQSQTAAGAAATPASAGVRPPTQQRPPK